MTFTSLEVKEIMILETGMPLKNVQMNLQLDFS